jgi:hypothetical protein
VSSTYKIVDVEYEGKLLLAQVTVKDDKWVYVDNVWDQQGRIVKLDKELENEVRKLITTP